MIRFIDRGYELDLLEESWNSKGAKFVVVYGRRRVGKTRLILEFSKKKDGIFFIAEDTNKKTQIDELKNKIAEYFDDEFLRRADLKEWRDLFDYLPKIMPKTKRIYFMIDEFSYVLKNDPSVPSALQKFWDTYLSSTEIFFLVSGSILGLISEKVLSSASPLYGRRTRDLLIRPLTFEHSVEFFKMPFAEKMRTYMAIGGVPEYLLKAKNFKNSKDFFDCEFFKKDGYFYREPYFLLSQEFREMKTYFTILNAISYGNTKPTEIANFAGLNSREIYPYLENLMMLGFIKKVSPVLGKRKAGIYLINDAFFDFWFNFVYKNREDIEKDEFRADEGAFDSYFGKRFELLVRDELAPRMLNQKIGTWWHKDREIDLVAPNEQTKEILFGECKWQHRVNPEKVLRELKEKAGFVDWHTGERDERYVIFAKSFKEKIEEPGLTLFDLEDVKKTVTCSPSK
jgi:AAA+ ATPase superfamily predicted ATPase